MLLKVLEELRLLTLLNLANDNSFEGSCFYKNLFSFYQKHM